MYSRLINFFSYLLWLLTHNKKSKGMDNLSKGLKHFKGTFEVYFFLFSSHHWYIHIFSKKRGLCGFKAVVPLVMSISVAETSGDSLKFYDPLRKSMRCHPCSFYTDGILIAVNSICQHWHRKNAPFQSSVSRLQGEGDAEWGHWMCMKVMLWSNET